MSIDRVARESASLRQRVTESIRDAILNGHLKPGQKLVERELCTSLDISRTLLRESMPQLQAEGLITSIAHKGPSVAMVDADEVKEIYQVRKALESLAAREFAINASDEQVQRLREQQLALEQPGADKNLRDLLAAKAGFYNVLFEGCNNNTASKILTQLNNRMVLYKRFSLSVPGRLPEVIQELDAIVSAIEARDPQRAAELSDVHILNAERTVLRRLSSETELPPKDEAETIPSQM